MTQQNQTLVKLENAGVLVNEKWLVRGVSLEIKKGKIITLIGPNGSGKSTTAKITLGLYKNIEGRVEKFTNKIAYVPQKINIDWTLPIRVNEKYQELFGKDISKILSVYEHSHDHIHKIDGTIEKKEN